jgi:hypothetical protein
MQRSRAIVTLLRQHLRSLGLDLPAKLAKDLDAADRWAAGVDRLGADRRALAIATGDAIAAGKDPADDPDVRRLATAATLAREQVGQSIGDVADDRRATALTRHADALVGVLATEVGRIDQALTRARDTIGADALPRVLGDPTRAATTLGADALAAWAGARDATARLGVIVKAWRMLAEAVGAAHVPARSASLVLVVAAPDAATLARAVAAHGPSEQAAALAGLPLSLATFAEYHERTANIEQQRAAQKRANDQKAQKPLKRAAGNFAA